MGYSIGIRTRSKALHKRMPAFMEVNYRSWPKMLTGEDGDAYAGAPTDDLSYDHAKTAIGLDYGVCYDWEREYAYAIVRWMALRVGSRRRTFSNKVRLDAPTHFMVYDGHETWPLIVGTKTTARKLPEKLQWCAVDTLGLKNGPDAPGYFAPFSVFTIEGGDEAFQRVQARVGRRVDEKVHVWRRKFNQGLLQEKVIRADVEKNLGTIRAELTRLATLWGERA